MGWLWNCGSIVTSPFDSTSTRMAYVASISHLVVFASPLLTKPPTCWCMILRYVPFLVSITEDEKTDFHQELLTHSLPIDYNWLWLWFFIEWKSKTLANHIFFATVCNYSWLLTVSLCSVLFLWRACVEIFSYRQKKSVSRRRVRVPLLGIQTWKICFVIQEPACWTSRQLTFLCTDRSFKAMLLASKAPRFSA